MTPDQAIAMLDRQIAAHGQDVTLLRVVANAPWIERPHRAFARGYRPDELTGGIIQGDTLVTLSPTGMPAEFTGRDDALRPGDRIVIGERSRNVEYVDPVEISGVLVRINLLVRG